MTEAEILAVPAGLAMDRLIAQYVMRWSQWTADKECWVTGPDQPIAYLGDDELPNWSVYRHFHPSTDIAAAVEVADHVAKVGWHLSRHVKSSSYVCQIVLKEGLDYCFEVRDVPSAPLALCQASMIAVCVGRRTYE